MGALDADDGGEPYEGGAAISWSSELRLLDGNNGDGGRGGDLRTASVPMIHATVKRGERVEKLR